MKIPDILQALQPVIIAFEKLSIPYYIGGSIASSIYGMARATMDVDVIADIKMNQLLPFRKFLENEYYIDESMISDAINRLSSFNLIHLESMIKIDVFIHKHEYYSEQVIQRIRKDTLEDSENAKELYFSSPEDIILNKLLWYEKGGRTSERQWFDVLGVLKIQSKKLDFEYLLKWADKLHTLDLLKTALKDAEIEI